MQSRRFQISSLQENSEVQILGISLVVQWLRFQAPDEGIIPQGGHNKVAIDVISATIEKSLTQNK